MMNIEMKKQLFDAAPILYGMAVQSPAWKITVPDELFPFLLELSIGIEKFNQRYKKRYVRVLKISISEGQLEFLTQRQVPAVDKLITQTRQKIRRHRKILRDSFLGRAKHMGTTALFGSTLLPDWKRTMPDELAALRKILEYAEKFAISSSDWESLANWYRQYLRDDENAARCSQRSLKHTPF